MQGAFIPAIFFSPIFPINSVVASYYHSGIFVRQVSFYFSVYHSSDEFFVDGFLQHDPDLMLSVSAVKEYVMEFCHDESVFSILLLDGVKYFLYVLFHACKVML